MPAQPHPKESPDKPSANDRGAGFVEYGLLLALMAFALLTMVDALGDDTHDSIDDSASSVAEF
ncbi:MAG: hypothetical protein OSA99_17970 [Acidimicrobiales bacterium]|nr:hypothetical protein [Acidimicrobiales bacterium]